ncbi:MAG: cytochrome C oxidase subunit IV family protein [Saprospiraceae bacterium]|nr:cytochrome C oxidase subunit IV family protein [Saprospiraceae bacterium]
MSAHTYEESKTIALKTIKILGVVTIIEVLIALTGKGYLIPGWEPYESTVGGFPLGRAIMYLLMISLSIYKAVLVIFEFMHMKYEVKGLVRSVLLPTALLIWAIIAFFMEGNYWKNSRSAIQDKNIEQVDTKLKPVGEVKPADNMDESHH